MVVSNIMRWRYFAKLHLCEWKLPWCRIPHTWRTLCVVFIGTNLLALLQIYLFGYFQLTRKLMLGHYNAMEVAGQEFSATEELLPVTQAFKEELEDDNFPVTVHPMESIEDPAAQAPFSGLKSNSQEIFFAKYSDKDFCNLPKMTPFHKSVLPYLKRQFPAGVIPCRSQPRYPAIFTTDLVTTLVQKKPPGMFNLSDCCYLPLLDQGKADKHMNSSSNICTPIKRTETVIPDALEFIKVICTNQTETVSSKQNVTIDLFAFARLRPKTKERMRKAKAEQETKGTEGKDRLNVIIFGFDGTSAMNFERIMPKTRKFLMDELGAFVFKGYTKTGDNTYPNLAPMFFGLNTTELEEAYWKKRSRYYDFTPLPWKYFEQHGYATSFIEDSAWMGMFNYGKRGFKVPPVDFYARNFMLQSAKQIGNHRVMNSRICYGSRLSIEVIHDYMKKVATAVGTTERLFLLSWACALGHDVMNLGYLGDNSTYRTLQWFKSNGYLENSTVIFVSDHGSRYGGIRNVIQGRLEERMPLLYFAFPPWFRTKYPLAMRNMKMNEGKLTSHYDFYVTLMDLLDTENLSDVAVERRSGQQETKLKANKYPRGMSLFLPVPARRSCAQAGVPRVYCVCFHKKRLTTTTKAIASAVQQGLASVNRHLKSVGKGRCEPIVLQRILGAERIDLEYQHEKQGWRSNVSRTYSIQFAVQPDDLTVEGKFWQELPNGKWALVDVLTRLDNRRYDNEGCLKKQSELAKVMCKCKKA